MVCAACRGSCKHRPGEVPEWLNGAVSKTVEPLTGFRGFESLPLRQRIAVEARMASSLGFRRAESTDPAYFSSDSSCSSRIRPVTSELPAFW